MASRPGPFRAVALCMSGGLRALCGAAAGGSKAALTMHFAQPDNGLGSGDVGDLSAKDGSKETVLALFGMLVRPDLPQFDNCIHRYGSSVGLH